MNHAAARAETGLPPRHNGCNKRAGCEGSANMTQQGFPAWPRQPSLPLPREQVTLRFGGDRGRLPRRLAPFAEVRGPRRSIDALDGRPSVRPTSRAANIRTTTRRKLPGLVDARLGRAPRRHENDSTVLQKMDETKTTAISKTLEVTNIVRIQRDPHRKHPTPRTRFHS
jgi:hypothetical protein